MSNTLEEIAKQIKYIKGNDKQVILIYAFNGTGKTRLSQKFKELVDPESDEVQEKYKKKILYYNAFTEDLLYWDNSSDFKLKIHNNSFTNWILKVQGEEKNVIENFQRYTDKKLTPKFNEDFSEVTFSFSRGNNEIEPNIKISKGEESNFIWSIFYTLLKLVIETLDIPEKSNRSTEQFDELEYIFIDDPVSSLDENHLIELAVDLASLIRDSKSSLKFIITTHNPLFYNVLWNEFGRTKGVSKKILKKESDGSYKLDDQNDAPFSYHLYLKDEIEKAIANKEIRKYHFHFLRHILEKTSVFLGYDKWEDLLSNLSEESSKKDNSSNNDKKISNPYAKRIINLSSHSHYSGEEIIEVSDNDKRVLEYLIKRIIEVYKFKSKS